MSNNDDSNNSSSSSSSSSSNNASLGPPPETATWIKYVPETFGIREAVRKSPFRWCAREG